MAVAFDSASSATSNTGPPSSLSWSHICSGANRLLTVGVHWVSSGGAVSVSGVTYNGVAMSSVGVVNNGDVFTQLFRLVAPATGSNTIAITMTGAVDQTLTGGGVSFTGVDQTTPLGTWASATGNSQTASVNVSSATDDIVVDHVSDASLALSVGAGQTERYNVSDDGGTAVPGGAGSTEAGATTVTMSWSIALLSIGWAIGGVSVKAASAAATPGRISWAELEVPDVPPTPPAPPTPGVGSGLNYSARTMTMAGI